MNAYPVCFNKHFLTLFPSTRTYVYNWCLSVALALEWSHLFHHTITCWMFSDSKVCHLNDFQGKPVRDEESRPPTDLRSFCPPFSCRARTLTSPVVAFQKVFRTTSFLISSSVRSTTFKPLHIFTLRRFFSLEAIHCTNQEYLSTVY